MIQVSGDCVEVSGPMTMAGAAILLAEGEAAIAENALAFDLAAVTDMDSSCLAVISAGCAPRAMRARSSGCSIHRGTC